MGITRARKELYLSSANSRMMFGQTKRNKHSRFLDEIDPDLLTVEQSPVARQMQMVRQRYQSDARGGYPSNNSGAYLNREYNRVPANSTGVNITIKPRQTGTRLTSGFRQVRLFRRAVLQHVRSNRCLREMEIRISEWAILWSTRCLVAEWCRRSRLWPEIPLWRFALKSWRKKKTMANYAPLKKFEEAGEGAKK